MEFGPQTYWLTCNNIYPTLGWHGRSQILYGIYSIWGLNWRINYKIPHPKKNISSVPFQTLEKNIWNVLKNFLMNTKWKSKLVLYIGKTKFSQTPNGLGGRIVLTISGNTWCWKHKTTVKSEGWEEFMYCQWWTYGYNCAKYVTQLEEG